MGSIKKFPVAVLVVFGVSFLLGAFVHDFFLAIDYEKISNLFRTNGEKYFIYTVIGYLSYSVAFVWIYDKGRENKPYLVQGIRFAAMISLVTVIPVDLYIYSAFPIPGSLVVKQIFFDVLVTLTLGIIVSWLRK